ncbi:MAG: class D sortase [Acidobacteria bacterium]|nr:class D sortase [Acidobacteriota bacterium]
MQNNPWIRWTRRLFFVVGIAALSWAAFALLDARLYQAGQSRRFQQELDGLKPSIIIDEHLHASSIVPAPAKENPLMAELIYVSGKGRTPLGRIEISTIGLEAMILEGTDARTLRRAVGHIPGTPLPGRGGNVAITGHRDTFFRPLRNIRKDDEIRLTTLSGSYRYRVDTIKVVEPEDMKVLDKSEDAILTLVTCYPFYYVGPAPKRFVVRARRVFPDKNSPGAHHSLD